MVDVEWCVLAVFYCLETNTPLLSSCNLLIQLKQGQLASLFSIPFFLYSRNVFECSFFTARELCAFLLSSAVTQGSWVRPATSAPHPTALWAGADKKKPEQLKEEGYSYAVGGGRVASSKRTVWTVTFLFVWNFWKLASDPTVNKMVAHMRLQGTCHTSCREGPQPMRLQRIAAIPLLSVRSRFLKSAAGARQNERVRRRRERRAPPEEHSGSGRASLKRRKEHLKCHMSCLGQRRF